MTNPFVMWLQVRPVVPTVRVRRSVSKGGLLRAQCVIRAAASPSATPTRAPASYPWSVMQARTGVSGLMPLAARAQGPPLPTTSGCCSGAVSRGTHRSR